MKAILKTNALLSLHTLNLCLSIGLTLAALLTSGCTAPKATSAEELAVKSGGNSSDFATVYVARQGGVGWLEDFQVSIDSSDTTFLGPGMYQIYKLPAGTHLLVVGPGAGVRHSLTVERGRKYFFRTWHPFISSQNIKMEALSEPDGQKMVSFCKLAAPHVSTTKELVK